ncbi:MAG: type restriction enzyme protein [Verrucomicrobiota bacterium]|jgi:type I restriction-modification system DNA methylase subunit
MSPKSFARFQNSSSADLGFGAKLWRAADKLCANMDPGEDRHVVFRLLVEMLAPYKSRIYDPYCGSGGMFVQSEKFVEAYGGNLVYG